MFSERIVRLKSSIVRDILAAAQSPSVISFAGGLPANESLPSPRAITLPRELGQYGETEGEPELRRLVSARLAAHGLDCPAERILILSGSQQGIDLVSKLFIDDGVHVLTENPSYLAALQAFTLFGAQLRGLPLTAAGVDPDALDHAARTLAPRFFYCVPSFQNPTGCLYDSATRAAVGRVLDEYGLPLFEDDPYRELALDCPVDKPICARLERASWVYQGSFSKTFMPGIRLGYLAASADLFGPLVKLKQAADLHSNRVGQYLAARDLQDPEREQRLSALRASYRDKRDHFDRALRTHLGDLAHWAAPSGGLFYWLRLERKRDLLALLPRAIEAGVAFVPGEAFFVHDDSQRGSYLRLNFSHTERERVDEGLQRLSRLLRMR